MKTYFKARRCFKKMKFIGICFERLEGAAISYSRKGTHLLLVSSVKDVLEGEGLRNLRKGGGGGEKMMIELSNYEGYMHKYTRISLIKLFGVRIRTFWG